MTRVSRRFVMWDFSQVWSFTPSLRDAGNGWLSWRKNSLQATFSALAWYKQLGYFELPAHSLSTFCFERSTEASSLQKISSWLVRGKWIVIFKSPRELLETYYSPSSSAYWFVWCTVSISFVSKVRRSLLFSWNGLQWYMFGRVSALYQGTSSDSVQSAHDGCMLGSVPSCVVQAVSYCMIKHLTSGPETIHLLSQCGRISTINLHVCVRLLMSLINNYWLKLSARFMHNNIPVHNSRAFPFDFANNWINKRIANTNYQNWNYGLWSVWLSHHDSTSRASSVFSVVVRIDFTKKRLYQLWGMGYD